MPEHAGLHFSKKPDERTRQPPGVLTAHQAGEVGQVGKLNDLSLASA